MKGERNGFYKKPAQGWVCFFCGECFTEEVTAQEHFGPTPDFLPACLDRATHDDAALLARARTAEAECAQQVSRAIEAEFREEAALSQLFSLGSHFPGATSVYEAWCQFHIMEGRALAAEALLREIEKSVPQEYSKAWDAVVGGERIVS